MAKKINGSFSTIPVENHQTAAWMENTQNVKPHSQVAIPTESAVENAKKWVDAIQL